MTTEYTIGDLTRDEFLYMLGLVGVDDPKVAALASLSWGGAALKVLRVNASENGWELVPGDSLTVTAGQALGGHRAVYIAADGKAYYAAPDATSRLTIGITTGAASLSAPVTIQTGGEVDEPSWTWAATGPVWLAASGQLTQILPTTGYLFQVGIPMGPTRLRIEPQLVAQLP
jgi:hypothetical protein